jgi:hypothetical protein
VTAALVISLDFELRWGLLDILGDDVQRYRANLEGVREAVPRLLEAFVERGVHATWAVVGALACDGWDEWHERSPLFPRYEDPALSWREGHRRLDPSGRLYFAPELVELVMRTPGQEVGSHTFNHVYALEPGFTRNDAEADARAMVRLFDDKWRSVPRAHVFPRNQIGHLDVLRRHGIVAWRDNPRPFFWSKTVGADQSPALRALRLADSLAPLGRRAAPTSARRASYFVRVNLPEPLFRLHVRRIIRDAARLSDTDVLHLWWHPHNLGAAPARSVERIAALLDAVIEAAPRGVRLATMTEA